MSLIVNDEPVDQEWINQEFSQIKSWHEQRSQVSCCERDDEFMAMAKDNVIGRVLLNQEARSRIPSLSDAEIDAALEQLKKDYGGEQQFMAATGVMPNQMEQVREQVELNGQVDKLIRCVCGDEGEPTEENLRIFYDEHIDLYTTEERVRAMHIYKSFRENPDREALFKQCREVRQQLVDGADFKAIASGFSDKPKEEIDLGFYKRGELMDEFEFVTFSMGVGEVSPVFTSYHGFHLAKVIEREPATAKPFEEIKDQVKEDFLNEIRNEKIQQFVSQLKSKAKIDDKPDEENAE